MLNNLRAELVRKELNPEKAIIATLGCTWKTANSKLRGESDFTVPEALEVVNAYFPNEKFKYDFEFLFENSRAAKERVSK